jgi:magnesium chelatase subunit I
MVANATRRSLKLGEDRVVPRVSDLAALAASTSGKLEIESLDDGREAEILEHLINSAVLTVFREVVPPETHRGILDSFDEGATVEAGDILPSVDIAGRLSEIPAMDKAVKAALEGETDGDDPIMVASAVEFILEGLHLGKRLNKNAGSYQAKS